jgi:chaperonin cofactor prefoldin
VTDDQITSLIDRSSTAAAEKARVQLEVVVERLENRIDLALEGVLGLNQRLDTLTDEMRTGFREVSARIDVSVAQLSDRLATLEAEQSALAARVAKIEAALSQ